MAVHYGRNEAAAKKTAAAIEQAAAVPSSSEPTSAWPDIDTLFAGLEAGLAGIRRTSW